MRLLQSLLSHGRPNDILAFFRVKIFDHCLSLSEFHTGFNFRLRHLDIDTLRTDVSQVHLSEVVVDNEFNHLFRVNRVPLASNLLKHLLVAFIDKLR